MNAKFLFALVALFAIVVLSQSAAVRDRRQILPGTLGAGQPGAQTGGAFGAPGQGGMGQGLGAPRNNAAGNAQQNAQRVGEQARENTQRVQEQARENVERTRAQAQQNAGGFN